MWIWKKGFNSNRMRRKPVKIQKYEMTHTHDIKLKTNPQIINVVWWSGSVCTSWSLMADVAVVFSWLLAQLTYLKDYHVTLAVKSAGRAVGRRHLSAGVRSTQLPAGPDQHNNSCRPVTGTQLNTRDLHFAAKRRARRPRSPVLVTCPARVLPHSPIV